VTTAQPDIVVIVTAYNEADRLGATLAALDVAFPGAQVVVADDGSADASSHVALQHGAEVVRLPVTKGKGEAATAAAERVLHRAHEPDPPLFVLCDGDLAESAGELPKLVEAVRAGTGDLVVASFARRVGGGFGFALEFARWAIKKRSGLELEAPISGQRAMKGEVLPVVVPFAHAFGMEIGMTVDAARAGYTVAEVEIDLAHRATGKTLRGFLHRFRQLRDFVRVYLDRS
jgi:glycosyltransferase involved in cell wall biosynthesis